MKTFYQPQRTDFRGRVYPSNTGLHNQGDHHAKGMMQFNDAVRLGESGLRALKIHVANCWGFDKESLDRRVGIIDERAQEIARIATDLPYAAAEIAKADEPLTFYAAACDLNAALQLDNPTDHHSRTAIAIDGTCNGLQILSLLGHDPVGAKKTNCTSYEHRQDVYMEVGDIAYELVEEALIDETEVTKVDHKDADIKVTVARHDLAEIWYAALADKSFRRKSVKRAIMTTAYGVSDRTIGKNLLDDGVVQKLDLPEWVTDYPVQLVQYLLADFFRDIIIKARSGAVSAAVDIMDYFSDIGSALGKVGLPMSWTLPDGSRVTQAYHETKEQSVYTGELGRIRYQTTTNKVKTTKQSSGAAPQVVHSLDATMLRMVSERLSEAGIDAVSMIHDSYGVHAGHIDTLNTILREVAVELFAGNWLLDGFHAEQLKAVEGMDVELPTPPAQGDLDVAAEIPKAVYFFS